MAIISKRAIGVVRLKGGANEYQLLADKLVQNIQECVVRCQCETNTGVVKCIMPLIADFRGNFGNVKFIFIDSDKMASSNKIVIEAAPGDTINGAATHEITLDGGSEIIEVGDSSTWVLA